MAEKWAATDTRKIAATTTDKAENFVTGCTGFLISSDADCFVDFDRTATTSSLLIKANQVPVYLPCFATQFHVITGTGTANVYIVGLRNSTTR